MLSAAQVLSRQQVSKAESATRVGVVLLHWGGPDKPEHIDAFLQNVYEDPSMVRLPGGQWFRPYFSRAAWTLQRKGIRKQYDSVGGYSPAIGLALEQARGLENLLKHSAQKHHDVTFKVYTSMQFSHPSAAETARRLDSRWRHSGRLGARVLAAFQSGYAECSREVARTYALWTHCLLVNLRGRQLCHKPAGLARD